MQSMRPDWPLGMCLSHIKLFCESLPSIPKEMGKDIEMNFIKDSFMPEPFMLCVTNYLMDDNYEN